MCVVIKAENLGKKYIISHENKESYLTFRDKIASSVKNIGKSFFSEKELNPTKEEFWALKGINFEISQGDRVGIIGRNGAGKSTLLKILSRITEPTEGRVKIKGRVASLLEVGTGFHPELTGRENIFFNGSLLGMTRAEIKKKFDEIAEFSGVEKFIDTPVKRYSSGMYVRLAFAVAAHLESEILIVDEVLAVGDAEFQKKCLGKMEDVSRQGRTVLFVSHNIEAISTLTQKSLLLNSGKLDAYNNTNSIITQYLTSLSSTSTNRYTKSDSELDINKVIEFEDIMITFNESNEMICKIKYIVRKNVRSVIAILITSIHGIPLITVRDIDTQPEAFIKEEGQYTTEVILPTYLFSPNDYLITFSMADMVRERYDYLKDVLSFHVSRNPEIKNNIIGQGVISLPTYWNTNKVN